MKDTKYISVFFKFLVALIIMFTTVFSEFLDIGKHHEAKAIAPLVYDGQFGCLSENGDKIGGKSGDDSGDDDEGGGDGSYSDKIKDRIRSIYDKLHGDYGLSGEAVAGILGNWSVETGGTFDPKAVEGYIGNFSVENAKKETNSANKGIGYGQWTFSRHTELVDYAKEQGKDWWDSDLQLDYMVKKDSAKGRLKEYALNSSDDILDNTVAFHNDWEISADTPEKVISARGDATKKAWKFLKKEGMDGKKDEKKIKKIGGDGDSSSSGVSSADNEGEETGSDFCGIGLGQGGETSIEGKMGDTTKRNGKQGAVIAGNWEWDDIPKKYKKYITLPPFDKRKDKDKWLSHPNNTYVNYGGGKNIGQCTELTWAYMSSLWGKEQTQGTVSAEVDGNGGVIWKAYEKLGADITGQPTVGYGFSAQPNGGVRVANAAAVQPGHTGVVVGVMPDGKWIFAQYNVNPKPAKSRTVLYSVADGAPTKDTPTLRFFSGIKGSKPTVDMKKGKGKDKD
ncbi:phage tail tip lysozyme [Staphylococcus hominis]